MPRPSAPVKTPAGHEELRHRTHRLSQRHRTVLLLVDGQRTLDEVLDLARKAGAQAAHLEALVQLGMVEMPPEPVAEAAEPEEGAALEATVATAVDVPSPAPAPELEPKPASEPAPEPEAVPAWADAPEPSPGQEPARARESAREPSSGSGPAANVPGAAMTLPEPALPVHARVVPPPRAESALAADLLATPAPQSTFDTAHVDGAVLDGAALPAGDAEMLDEVRRLLIDTLRRDTLLARVFAPGRVRTARTQEALIALVWEIEHERAHTRRKRIQLLNLQRARDLLGMGNTLVAGDSVPPPSS